MKMKTAMPTLVLLATLLALAAPAPPPARAGEEWFQFRGPTGQGASGATGLPAELGEGQHVVWKTPIHDKGWSSPVVLGDHIWLTTATPTGDKLYVVCVDLNSGNVLVDQKLFDVPTPQYAHPFNSYASPTPTVEAGRVYVSFGSPGVACVDASTARVIWERRDFVCNHFRGPGSSPVLFRDLLLLHFDGSDHQFVAAVNKADGKTVWETKRSVDFKDLHPDGKVDRDGDMRKAFSTPRVVDHDGKPVMYSLGSKCMYAYDPLTGAEIWRAENSDNYSGSATPVIAEDGTVFVCMGLGQNQLWALRPGGRGVVTESHVLWKVRKNVPGRPSPVYHDGLLYMVDDNGIATCLDARAGGEVWKGRLKGNYSASPLLADGRLYFFGEDGTASVLQPGREFKVLSTGKFDDGFMASPAVAGRALILRTKTHLYRIEQK